MIIRISLIRNQKGRSILMRDGAIATRTIIALFGICCEGRSVLMRDGAIALGTIIALFGIWCEGRSGNHSIAPNAIGQNTGKGEQLLGKLELLKVSGV